MAIESVTRSSEAIQLVRRPVAVGAGEACSGHLGVVSLQIEPRLEPMNGGLPTKSDGRGRAAASRGRGLALEEWRSDSLTLEAEALSAPYVSLRRGRWVILPCEKP